MLQAPQSSDECSSFFRAITLRGAHPTALAFCEPPPAPPPHPPHRPTSWCIRALAPHPHPHPLAHAPTPPRQPFTLLQAVVGGGAAGLAAARQLLLAGHGPVTVYERSSILGGVWAYSEDVEDHPLGLGSRHVHGSIYGSMYAGLRTNLPREVMGFRCGGRGSRGGRRREESGEETVEGRPAPGTSLTPSTCRLQRLPVRRRLSGQCRPAAIPWARRSAAILAKLCRNLRPQATHPLANGGCPGAAAS